MCIQIGPELQCSEGWRQNSKLYKNKGRIQINVWENRTRIPVNAVEGQDKRQVFITIRPEFHYFEGWGQNSIVYKNKARIQMFGRITSLFQSL